MHAVFQQVVVRQTASLECNLQKDKRRNSEHRLSSIRSVLGTAERVRENKCKVHPVGKVMASVFWDSQRILLVAFLRTGATINSERH